MKKKMNKEEKKLKRQRKKAQRIKKKVSTTLKWSEVVDIKNNLVYLKKGRQCGYMKGVKIAPRTIFIETPQIQKQLINNFRIALNKLPMDLYWGFIFIPVNIDAHFAALTQEMKMEEDPVIKGMMQGDFEKACWFCDTHREIEFTVMVTSKDYKDLCKQYDKLVIEMTSQGFHLQELDNTDYENYFAYLYENEMINDYYFSRGIFSCLRDGDEITSPGQMYFDNEYCLEEEEVEEYEIKQL